MYLDSRFQSMFAMIPSIVVLVGLIFVIVIGVRTIRKRSGYTSYGMKSKGSAIVLSLLFGALGLDRFYLGYVGLGFLKLLTLGGFGIWWLIDFILICAGSLTPADGSDYYGEEDKYTASTNQYTDTAEAIAKLHNLLEQGIINQEEFDEKKETLLDRI